MRANDEYIIRSGRPHDSLSKSVWPSLARPRGSDPRKLCLIELAVETLAKLYIKQEQ